MNFFISETFEEKKMYGNFDLKFEMFDVCVYVRSECVICPVQR